MPELPEVEITRRGIAPHVEGRRISDVIVRHHGLRWPVPADLAARLVGLTVRSVARRAKYLVLDCGAGQLLLHLGMTGSLRVVDAESPPGAWDHVDLVFGARALRLRDPRRFGAVLWHEGRIEDHALIAELGVEPLEDAFTGAFLYDATRGREVAVKLLLMNAAIVVGVGNIYANESLFRAGIRPTTAACRLSRARCEVLARTVRETLAEAIEIGTRTAPEFIESDGASGYFAQAYFVYDRQGAPCRVCATPIRRILQAQRSSFFCSRCQRA